MTGYRTLPGVYLLTARVGNHPRLHGLPNPILKSLPKLNGWYQGNTAPIPYRTDTITGSIVSVGLNLVSYAENSGPYHTHDDIFDAPSVLDRAEADCTETRPVLAFSHGDTAISYQSIFLTEYLASRGWVIVAPNHRGNTLFEPEEHRIALALRRPIDIRDTVDWLFGSLGATGGDLNGCVNPDDGYAISGHSFGGYTTLATAGQSSTLAVALQNPKRMDVRFRIGLDRTRTWQRIDLGDEQVWAAMPMALQGMRFYTADWTKSIFPCWSSAVAKTRNNHGTPKSNPPMMRSFTPNRGTSEKMNGPVISPFPIPVLY